MLEGIGVVIFQTAQGQQCVRVAEDGINHVFHQRLDLFQLDLLTQTDVADQAAGNLGGLGVQPFGVLPFLGDGGAGRRFRRGGDALQLVCNVFAHRLLRRSIDGEVGAPLRVDIKLMDAKSVNLPDGGGILD